MIAVRGVTKRFGSVRAIDDLTLEIPTGEVVVLQGPSGSGKTTLLRLIAGLELPDTGEIWIDHQLVGAPGWAAPPHQRGIGVVFQRSALWPHMTVAQNIRFAINGAAKADAWARMSEIVEQMVLQDLVFRYPSQLSGGEARRVALARAIASRPKRLLLDEPLTSLDPDLKEHLLDAIRIYTEQAGATVLYITHDEVEARKVDGTLVRMDRGRIVG